MKYIDEFRMPGPPEALVRRIRELPGEVRLMEVCGTHTVAISRAGLRQVLSPGVELVSGPGCPVCVTAGGDIDRAVATAKMPGVVLATFGDMMKVPGTEDSLAGAAARGAKVKVVYSPLEALELARENPATDVVFLGVGFETTAPAVAATVLEAVSENLCNFYLLSFHKLVPPALRALVTMPDFGVDGFILPGHVSVIIGSEAYRFLVDEYSMPCVVAGFETVDVLQAISRLKSLNAGIPALETEYSRAVRPGGNRKALSVMWEVFEPAHAEWRGLGLIPGSGLALKDKYRDLDAGTWELELPEPAGPGGCRCGDILCGRIRPDGCPLFGSECTPEYPVGPCMVSGEGTCAAYYLYEREGA